MTKLKCPICMEIILIDKFISRETRDSVVGEHFEGCFKDVSGIDLETSDNILRDFENLEYLAGGYDHD